ncbi:methylated-DNA--[protein]-cysteine S-methyltransferase [Solitalea koreensis]|uniref:Methylated-DNA--protein-cysteine methyltransferase n=1 Tax=Solitalea koreensis TaxID=543615 RepID=A0A521DP24_9SPHI|nr:methylated-DNA--[protein]-cysteine S-methyltransferase [Solitalea koreensis]SMO73443.1 methylated-DNA-[protein]-cysteine S-methyltransferase [Solitalea koreensis]
MNLTQAYYHSPIGIIQISGDDEYIHSTLFREEAGENSGNSAVVKLALVQLDEYFTGNRLNFELPISQSGTTFQLSVWDQLTKIPYGETISYLQLSERLNNRLAIRAVGAANGKNNIIVIVPCHRVVGNDGSLTGFSAGLWRKKWLLQHENKISGKGQRSLF